MTIPKDYPLESFDPRFRELLLKGAKERFEVPCETPHQAYRLQVLLCVYRSRMKERFPNEPEKWQALYSCVVGQKNLGKDERGRKRRSNVLCLYPRNTEFDQVLSGLQLTVSEAPKPDLLDELLETLPEDKNKS